MGKAQGMAPSVWCQEVARAVALQRHMPGMHNCIRKNACESGCFGLHPPLVCANQPSTLSVTCRSSAGCLLPLPLILQTSPCDVMCSPMWVMVFL